MLQLASLLAAAAMIVAAFYLDSLGQIDRMFDLFYTGFVALVAWASFQRAVYAPMYGPAFWRAAIARGWVPRGTEPFYEMLARYKEERGRAGQLPGDVAWGVAYVAIYLITMVLAIGFVWFGFRGFPLPTVVLFSVVEFPLAIGCWLLYRARGRRQFDEALRSGYPFSSFRLGALRRLLP